MASAPSNSSSRLLLDYPPAARYQILDYLFLPKYGASLQLLKLEIGADTNSTTTAEPSHSRTPSHLDPDLSWSWWIAKQARARSPAIGLYGLMWGAPGWLHPNRRRGGMWSDDHVRYLLRWLDAAGTVYGSTISRRRDERYDPKPTTEFFVALKHALAVEHPDVQVVATDAHAPPDYWWAATQMRSNPEFADAVDVLGEHDVCVWRSEYRHCHVSAGAGGEPAVHRRPDHRKPVLVGGCAFYGNTPTGTTRTGTRTPSWWRRWTPPRYALEVSRDGLV